MSYDIHNVLGFRTQGGITIDIRLAYKCYGTLAPSRDNVILVLTSYSAQHEDAEALFAGSKILDLSHYFIVVINMIGNGLSTSPSNVPAPLGRSTFPAITVHDNVACQHRLITEKLGIKRLRLVMGFSMGALQTFEWGCQHTGIVDAILPICGAARVSPHNYLFLDGAKAALTTDRNFRQGLYETPPIAGLLAFGRVYAGWVFSQTFFRERAYEAMGLASMEDAVRMIQNYFMRRDANDLLAMLWTWQHADISANTRFRGDFEGALRSIACRAIVMPGETDLYFTVADSVNEVSYMPRGELRVIASVNGHMAGSGMDSAGKLAIDNAINDLLN